jgi:hypothetical protein
LGIIKNTKYTEITMSPEQRLIQYTAENGYEALSQQVKDEEILFANGNYHGIDANIRIADEQDFEVVTREKAIEDLSFFVINKTDPE